MVQIERTEITRRRAPAHRGTDATVPASHAKMALSLTGDALGQLAGGCRRRQSLKGPHHFADRSLRGFCNDLLRRPEISRLGSWPADPKRPVVAASFGGIVD